MGNTMKTVFLLGVLSAMIVAIAGWLGGPQWAVSALFFALVMNFVSYWFSDKIVLTMYRAKEVSPAEAPVLHSIVDKLVRKANMPKPRVYILPDPAPNAFATGRNPSHAAIAATEGILRVLNPAELEGVLAHELAHVKNRDILIGTIAATLAAAITYIAYMARFAAFFGGGSRDDEDGGGNIFALLALSILGPIAALLIQMAISRSREYQADHTGALISGNPDNLANALVKIHNAAQMIPMDASPATAHMFIVNPLTGGGLMSLFSTHPPVEERVRRLQELAASDSFRYRIS